MHMKGDPIPLPQDFVQSIREQFAAGIADGIADGDALLAAIENGIPHSALRLNPNKPCALPWELPTVLWEPNGRYITGAASRPGKHILHAAGAYYLQEPSAMLPAALLAPAPGERVLDLCAAPGGKTGQLAAAMRGSADCRISMTKASGSQLFEKSWAKTSMGMPVCGHSQDGSRDEIPGGVQGQSPARPSSTDRTAALCGSGILIANEIEKSRAPALVQNLERLGVNAIVLNERPDALAERFEGCFDAILADAPCSGEGMFRREPKSRLQWTPALPAACATRQLAILDSAAIMLRPGGRLVYSTCTFNHTENQGVVERFLDRHRDFSLITMRSILPHCDDGEGQFAALLLRSGNEQPRPWPLIRTIQPPPDWTLLAQQTLSADCSIPELTLLRSAAARPAFLQQGDWLYLPPEGAPELSGLRVSRPGLQIAHLRKGRAEPAHALAMALSPPDALRAIELSAENALKYLRGEPLPCIDADGWTLITHQSLPLGWAKSSNGWLKNHLPKGLRAV